MRFVTVLLLALPTIGFSTAQAPPPELWAPFAYFVGSWNGEESASFGSGRGERTYSLLLNGRYLLSQNVSRFPRQPSRPEGETHEDWTIFSYDTRRKTYVLRQFNSEGFVNQLVMEEGASIPRKMRFVGESAENAPPGTRVVLEYEVVGEDEFLESFEVAFPGGGRPTTIRNRWRRSSR
jgi:hypothetical protein